jgi:predicted secreted hydrolase
MDRTLTRRGGASGRPDFRPIARIGAGWLLVTGVLAATTPEASGLGAGGTPPARAGGVDPIHDTIRPVAGEWWLVSGHVQAADERWYAFQVGFYRLDVDRVPAGADPHGWRVRSIYPSFLVITDIGRGVSQEFTRLERSGIGTARHEEEPLQLRHRAWVLAERDGGFHLRAGEGAFALALELDGEGPLRPIPEAEPSPSITRSMIPRLRVSGTLVAGGRETPVHGVAALEHARKRPHAPSCRWDALTLHLREGGELILIAEEAASVRSMSGVFIAPSGEAKSLGGRSAKLYPIGTNRWTGEAGIGYSTFWRVEIPSLDLRLDLEATIPGQEVDGRSTFGLAFWRGAIVARGRRAGETLAGAGFLEVMGHGEATFPPALALGDAFDPVAGDGHETHVAGNEHTTPSPEPH